MDENISTEASELYGRLFIQDRPKGQSNQTIDFSSIGVSLDGIVRALKFDINKMVHEQDVIALFLSKTTPDDLAKHMVTLTQDDLSKRKTAFSSCCIKELILDPMIDSPELKFRETKPYKVENYLLARGYFITDHAKEVNPLLALMFEGLYNSNEERSDDSFRETMLKNSNSIMKRYWTLFEQLICGLIGDTPLIVSLLQKDEQLKKLLANGIAGNLHYNSTTSELENRQLKKLLTNEIEGKLHYNSTTSELEVATSYYDTLDVANAIINYTLTDDTYWEWLELKYKAWFSAIQQGTVQDTQT